MHRFLFLVLALLPLTASAACTPGATAPSLVGYDLTEEARLTNAQLGLDALEGAALPSLEAQGLDHTIVMRAPEAARPDRDPASPPRLVSSTRLAASGAPLYASLELAADTPPPGEVDVGSVLDQVSRGSWLELALNPQLWALVLAALFTIWKLVNPTAAQRAYALAFGVSDRIKQVGVDLYWAVEEAGRRGGLTGQGKADLFARKLPAALEQNKITPDAKALATATEAADAENAKRKATLPDPSNASAKA